MKNPNPIFRKFYTIMGSLLTVIAFALTVKPASIFGLHQPKAPKHLK